jgi:hypothetical protein
MTEYLLRERDELVAERDRLRAEVAALAALINAWAGEVLNVADRGKIAAAMLDTDAVRRYIARVNAEDDEVDRLRAELDALKTGRAFVEYETTIRQLEGENEALKGTLEQIAQHPRGGEQRNIARAALHSLSSPKGARSMPEQHPALSEREYLLLRAWFLKAMALTFALGVVVGVLIGAVA